MLSIKDNKKLLTGVCLLVGTCSVFAQTNDERSSLLESVQQEARDGVSISLFADVKHIDNVRKVNENEESDVANSYGVDFKYKKITRAVNAAANYRLRNTGYQDGSFSDDLWLSGSSQLIISTTPERYSWFVRHQQSAKKIDLSVADTPDNQDERSTLITGPDINLRLTSVDNLSLQGRYIETDFDESKNNNSNRNTANTKWSHSLNKDHRVSIVGDYSDVEFEEQPGNDYRQDSYGIELSGSYRELIYQFGGGSSAFKRGDNEKSEDSYSNLYVSWRQDDGLWVLTYNDRITDSSVGLSLTGLGLGSNGSFIDSNSNIDDDLDPEQGLGFGDADGNFNQSDVVRRVRTQVQYNRKLPGSRYGLVVRAYHDDSDYQTLMVDTKTTDGFIGLHYDATESLRFFANVSYQKLELLDNPIVEEDETGRLKLGFKSDDGSAFSWGMDAVYEKRESANLSSREYDALSTSLNVTYRLR